jgi:hypothetical protein
MKVKLIVCLGAAVMTSLGSGVAHAGNPTERVLRAGPPGGKVTGPDTVSWPGVPVTLAARPSEPVNYRRCPGKYVCLWQNRDATGRRIQFKRYGTYRLSNWGMSGRKGASSFYNHQCCGAHATLIGPNFRLSLWTWGNIPRSMNDRATYVKLTR